MPPNSLRFNFFLKCVILLPNLMYFKKKSKCLDTGHSYSSSIDTKFVDSMKRIRKYQNALQNRVCFRITSWLSYQKLKQSCPLIGIVLVIREYAESKGSHAFTFSLLYNTPCYSKKNIRGKVFNSSVDIHLIY